MPRIDELAAPRGAAAGVGPALLADFLGRRTGAAAVVPHASTPRPVTPLASPGASPALPAASAAATPAQPDASRAEPVRQLPLPPDEPRTGGPWLQLIAAAAVVALGAIAVRTLRADRYRPAHRR